MRKMVRYKGINFLEEAVDKRQSFKAKCLLTVPRHLDEADSYVHMGHMTYDKYRAPWNNGKVDHQFMIEEANNFHSDTLILNLSQSAYNNVEQYESESTDDENSLDLVDVIPSSNPSSLDIYSPLASPCQEQTIFTELPVKEDLRCFATDCEEWKILTISEDECLARTLKKLPSLNALIGNLHPAVVSNPLTVKGNKDFKDKPLLQVTDRHENEIEFWKEDNSDVNLFRDSIVTEPLPKNKENEEIEEVIVLNDPISLRHEACTMVQNLIEAETLESVPELDLKEIELTKKNLRSKCYGTEQLTLERDPHLVTSFLDVNEIVLTDEDVFCEKAYLDSPVGEPPLKPGHSFPHAELQLKPEPVSPGKLQIVKMPEKPLRKIWLEEKFCDEVQVSRIPEPEIENSLIAENALERCKSYSSLTVDHTIASVELQLSWELVKFSEKASHHLHQIEKLFYRKDYKGHCTRQEVEVLEKFSSADVFDWRDPLISLKEDVTDSNTACTSALDTADKPERSCIEGSLLQEGKLSLSWSAKKDPLSNFMALRAASVPRTQKSLPHDKNATAENLQGKVSFTEKAMLGQKQDTTLKVESYESSPPIQDMGKPKGLIQPRRRTKHTVLSVKLTDEFCRILMLLEEAATALIKDLKDSLEISPSYSFKTLTPDVTRFLLKQKEKNIESQNLLGTDDTSYRNILALHSLSGAAELVANCCLESAIEYLRAMQEKYSQILKGAIDRVRRELFHIKAQFYDQHKYHPKVVSLCREIESWLQRKRAKTKENEQKILVLVKRDLPSLMLCLKNALGISSLLIPDVLISSAYEDIIQRLDKHNCLIIYDRKLTDLFPWAQFSLVVEFEQQESSVWKDHCERQSIRHMALMIETEPQQGAGDQKDSTDALADQIMLIAACSVTQKTELLQILEARHNILLLERNYSLIQSQRRLYFSDLDVDEGTGVILQPLSELNDDTAVEMLVNKITALSLKYTTCWCLLYSSDVDKHYQFPVRILNSLSKLEATISNFLAKQLDFSCKMVVCLDMADTARHIRDISESSLAKREGKGIVPDGSWVSQDLTKMENFLLRLPCLSSLNANLLLKEFTLKDLFDASPKLLMSKMNTIPSKVLQNFFRIVHTNFGLRLRENNFPLGETPQDSMLELCEDQQEMCDFDQTLPGHDTSDCYIVESDDEIQTQELVGVNESRQRVSRALDFQDPSALEETCDEASGFALNTKTMQQLAYEEGMLATTNGSNGKKKRFDFNADTVHDQTKYLVNESSRDSSTSSSHSRDESVNKKYSSNGSVNRNPLFPKNTEWKLLQGDSSVEASNSDQSRIPKGNTAQNSKSAAGNSKTMSAATSFPEHDMSLEQYSHFFPMKSVGPNRRGSNMQVRMPSKVQLQKPITEKTKTQYSRNNEFEFGQLFTRPAMKKSNSSVCGNQSDFQATYQGKYNTQLENQNLSGLDFGVSNKFGDTRINTRRLSDAFQSSASEEDEKDAGINQNSSMSAVNALEQYEDSLEHKELYDEHCGSDECFETNFNPSVKNRFSENVAHSDFVNSQPCLSENQRNAFEKVAMSNTAGTLEFYPNFGKQRSWEEECRSRTNVNRADMQTKTGKKQRQVPPEGAFVNPDLKRLNLQTPHHHPHTRDVCPPDSRKELSIEDDLRETTRKWIANSQQFSKFVNHGERRPLQKINIGLAQPLQREATSKPGCTCLTL